MINLRLKDISFRHSGEIEIQTAGKLVYLWESFVERITKLKTEKTGTICTEINVAKPLHYSSKLLENWVFWGVGDLNVNTLRPTSDLSKYLSNLNDPFSLTILVTNSTCFKSNKDTLIDPSKPRSFYKSHSFVTGLRNCHKLFVSVLRTSFEKLPLKFVTKWKKLSWEQFHSWFVL